MSTEVLIERFHLDAELNASVTDTEWAALEPSILQVQGALESHLGKRLGLRTVTEHVTVDWDGHIRFGVLPVVEVFSLSQDGSSIDVSTLDVRAWGVAGPTFRYQPITIGLTTPPVTLASYRGGIDLEGEDGPLVLGLVADAVRRRLVRRRADIHGVESVGADGYTSKLVAPSAVFTAAELRSVARLRRKRSTWL